jgi:hypothetical protein
MDLYLIYIRIKVHVTAPSVWALFCEEVKDDTDTLSTALTCTIGEKSNCNCVVGCVDLVELGCARNTIIHIELRQAINILGLCF